MFGSNRKSHAIDITPSDSTAGTKIAARKNDRPASLRFSITANSTARPTVTGVTTTAYSRVRNRSPRNTWSLRSDR